MNIKRIDCKIGQTAVSMFIFAIRCSAKPWIVGKQVRSNIGTLERQNVGIQEYLYIGTLEHWNVRKNI